MANSVYPDESSHLVQHCNGIYVLVWRTERVTIQAQLTLYVADNILFFFFFFFIHIFLFIFLDKRSPDISCELDISWEFHFGHGNEMSRHFS